jgi:hypothetical protein
MALAAAHDWLIEYDISAVFLREQDYNRSTVYKWIGRFLRTRGWTKLQYSVWEKHNALQAVALAHANALHNALVARFPLVYAVGVAKPDGTVPTRQHLVKRIHFQQQVQPVVIANHP